jgi:hypothetical protein
MAEAVDATCPPARSKAKLQLGAAPDVYCAILPTTTVLAAAKVRRVGHTWWTGTVVERRVGRSAHVTSMTDGRGRKAPHHNANERPRCKGHSSSTAQIVGALLGRVKWHNQVALSGLPADKLPFDRHQITRRSLSGIDALQVSLWHTAVLGSHERHVRRGRGRFWKTH